MSKSILGNLVTVSLRIPERYSSPDNGFILRISNMAHVGASNEFDVKGEDSTVVVKNYASNSLKFETIQHFCKFSIYVIKHGSHDVQFPLRFTKSLQNCSCLSKNLIKY